MQEFQKGGSELHRRAQTELRPLLEEYNGLRASLLRLFDRHIRTGSFTANEKKKLRYIISDMAFDLITNVGMEELKPIFDFHNEQTFEEVEADMSDVSSEMLKSAVEAMFGIKVDADADVSTPEKMRHYVEEKMARQEAQQQEARAKREDGPKKPLTQKQLLAEEKRREKEAKRKEEEKKVTRSVRDVYMDLVKAFHPDRTPDEAEKIRHTAIMKEITAAYEENDLLRLLQLQMEFERIDAEHLGTLAEDRLKLFNKVLRTQVTELDSQLWELKSDLAMMAQKSPYMINSVKQLDSWLMHDIYAVKKGVREIKDELRLLDQPVTLRRWLKSYRIPKGKGADLEDLLGSMVRL